MGVVSAGDIRGVSRKRLLNRILVGVSPSQQCTTIVPPQSGQGERGAASDEAGRIVVAGSWGSANDQLLSSSRK